MTTAPTSHALRYWEKCAIYCADHPRPVVFDDHDRAATIAIYAAAFTRVHGSVRIDWNDDYKGRELVQHAADNAHIYEAEAQAAFAKRQERDQ